MLRPSTLVSIDPVVQFPPLEQVEYATCALLLNYRIEPFPAGARLYPEVARALPDVSDGGRSLHVPPAPRLPLLPAFERSRHRRRVQARDRARTAPGHGELVLRSTWATSSASTPTPPGGADHLAGVTARGDTLTIRLKEPSTTLPARLATRHVLRRAAEHADRGRAASRRSRWPGPYYFASYVPKRSGVLRRNPNYGGSRPARVKEIDIDLELSAARAWPAVEAGRADYVSAVPVESVGGAGAALRRAQRGGAHRRPALLQRAGAGDAPARVQSGEALFARKRMRRAVSAALDRRAMAASLIIPLPAESGASRRPVHTAGASGLPRRRDRPAGRTGSRAGQAKSAGDRHHRALLVTCNAAPCLNQARVVRQNLAEIGIDVEIKAFQGRAYFSGAYTKTPWDIGYGNWFADYADPSNYVGRPWLPRRSFGERLARRIRAATRLPDAARFDAFARLDADLSRTPSTSCCSQPP